MRTPILDLQPIRESKPKKRRDIYRIGRRRVGFSDQRIHSRAHIKLVFESKKLQVLVGANQRNRKEKEEWYEN